MHEFSVVQSLMGLIEENVKKNNAKSVSKVVVKIGKMSGIEPHLLKKTTTLLILFTTGNRL